MKPYFKEIIIAFAVAAIIPLWGLWYFGTFQPLVIAAAAPVYTGAEGCVSVNAVGDVMLGRKVGRLMKENGVNYPVEKTADLLHSADITFGNLECSLSDRGTKLPGKGIWLQGGTGNVQALQTAGFDLVNLANNHAMDYEEPALLQTLDVLDQAGIAHIGAGKDITEACAPYLTEVKDVKIAWLGYSEMADLFFSIDYPRPMRADQDSPGIAPYDLDRILTDIKAVKDRADIIIVTVHWGVEYTDFPQDYQVEAAHQMVDAGADIIIGHHPHCIQGVEVYKHGLIAYSMGNFIFDQDWSEKTSQGLLLELELNDLGWQSAQFVPISIIDCQPREATGQDGEAILKKLQQISSPFDGELTIKENRLLVSSGNTEGV